VVDAWSGVTGPPSAMDGGGHATLVQGTTFCVSDATGDVHAGTIQGLYVLDTRVINRLALRLDGHAPEPLTTQSEGLLAREFIGRRRPRPGHADSTVLVIRRRELDGGLWEHVTLRNVGDEAASCTVMLQVEADFADLFEVKMTQAGGRSGVALEAGEGSLTFSQGAAPHEDAVTVSAPQALAVAPGTLAWHVVIPARGTWSTTVRVAPVLSGRPVPMGEAYGVPQERTDPARRQVEWRRRAPRVSSGDPEFARLIQRSVDDLGALRIVDPEHLGRTVVAAGAPWFMALFGRDSLLSATMLLPVDPSLAVGTLMTLAHYQGCAVDPITEEEPGRILHEIRFGPDARIALGGRNVYYGSADSTPLFVMLLGELCRWGGAAPYLDHLLPHADAALAWIENYGDRDGDLFVEYRRATDRGLVNQGWKDSPDAVTFANGAIARAPIALAEVQGYAYAAFSARAHIAAAAGDADTARRCAGRAAALRAAFNEQFWLEDRGYYAIGLDAEKRPIDGLASNMGHCLWTGIIDPARAEAVADHLLSEEMFTGFGVRTLASTMAAYNPMSYHNGSVWPHDTAIVAAGLMRYGFVEHAQRIALGLIDAARHFGGSMPELFCGFDIRDFPAPIPYPTACSPQAWAAASPLLLLRTLLRLEPEARSGQAWFAPAVPDQLLPLHIRHLLLAGHPIEVTVTASEAVVDGVAETLVTVPEARPLDRDTC
jgi:glycogen debranching enzyme